MKPTIFYKIIEQLHHIGDSWDKLATNMNNAIEYAHQHINNEPERFIAGTQRYTMEYCLAHSGESINERFRSDRPDKIDLQIADMVSSHTTDTDLILYRGVCDYVYDQMKLNATDKNCDLYEKGFLATSLVKGRELNYKIKLRIYVPAGSHCVYQGNVNDEQGFYEVDIQRNARLEIISIDKEYINCKLLETA